MLTCENPSQQLFVMSTRYQVYLRLTSATESGAAYQLQQEVTM